MFFEDLDGIPWTEPSADRSGAAEQQMELGAHGVGFVAHELAEPALASPRRGRGGQRLHDAPVQLAGGHVGVGEPVQRRDREVLGVDQRTDAVVVLAGDLVERIDPGGLDVARRGRSAVNSLAASWRMTSARR